MPHALRFGVVCTQNQGFAGVAGTGSLRPLAHPPSAIQHCRAVQGVACKPLVDAVEADMHAL